MSYGNYNNPNQYPPQQQAPQQQQYPQQNQAPQGYQQQQAPQQGYQQGPPPQQPQNQGVVIDGWSAMQNGLEPGKAIEYEIIERQGQNNSRFMIFSLFKPYKSNKPEHAANPWKKGFGFTFGKSLNDVANELVDRINHALAKWGSPKGQYVFQPFLGQQQLPYGGEQQQNQPQPTQQQQAPVQQQMNYNPGPGGYPQG